MTDRKSKKRLEVLSRKLNTLRQRLAGARRQVDDPAEVERLQEEIGSLEAEIRKLKDE
jgi:archaellum component FlaC